MKKKNKLTTITVIKTLRRKRTRIKEPTRISAIDGRCRGGKCTHQSFDVFNNVYTLLE